MSEIEKLCAVPPRVLIGLAPCSYVACAAFDWRCLVMPNSDARGSNGARWRACIRTVKSWGRPCALCGRPIDYSLTTYRDPRDGKVKKHPMSFEVDHIVPVSRGGAPYNINNLQPTHRICNQRKGNSINGETPKAWRIPITHSGSFA